MMNKFIFGSPTPILGFCAYSGTGKTTLLTQLIPILKKEHLRLAVIKHAHHEFDVDKPGKDSYRLRKAGADQMLISSSKRWVLMSELNEHQELQLPELITHLDHERLDLVLVEGFKHIEFNKIELHRPEVGKPLMCTDDSNIIALATNASLSPTPDIPILDLDNVPEIARFVIDYCKLDGNTPEF